jgi:DNA-binding transcriptional ArsR family regulator
MPITPELLDRLLRNTATIQERLIILLVNDLDGRRVDLSTVNLSDVDRPGGILKIHEGDSPKQVRLDRETIHCFQQYISQRRSRDPSLLVRDDNGRLTSQELRGTISKIADRSGARFDDNSFSFEDLEKEQAGRIVTKTASRDLFYLYGIVSHPLRRQIIDLLGEEGPCSFTRIKSRIKVRVGTLYYHFDILKGLVAQDKQKRYFLTEAGKNAYSKLHSSEYVESSNLVGQHIPAERHRLDRLGQIFMFNWLWPRLQAKPLQGSIGGILLLGVGAFLVYQAGLETVLLFLNAATSKTILLPVELVIAWIVVYGIADIIGTYGYGRKGEHTNLLLGTAYALVPLIIFAAWWNLVILFQIRIPLVSTLAFSRVLLILLQAWALVLIAQAVSVSKGLRLGRSATISLVIAYVNIMIAYLRGV